MTTMDENVNKIKQTHLFSNNLKTLGPLSVHLPLLLKGLFKCTHYKKINTPPSCILCALKPQIIPLLTFMLARMWHEESPWAPALARINVYIDMDK